MPSSIRVCHPLENMRQRIAAFAIDVEFMLITTHHGHPLSLLGRVIHQMQPPRAEVPRVAIVNACGDKQRVRGCVRAGWLKTPVRMKCDAGDAI